MTLTPTKQTGLHRKVTLEEWISKAHQWKKATRELVRMWFENNLGSHRECAKHLGVAQSTVTEHRVRLIKAGDLAGEIDQTKQHRSETDRPVENVEPIDVEVVDSTEEVFLSEALNTPNEDIRAKLKTKKDNQAPTTTDNTNVRRPTEQLRDHRSDSDNESIRGLHEQLLQQSDEPETYKDAARLLREVSKLLEYSKQDGWSEAAFGALRDDAESIASSCAACSRNSRERAHQEAQNTWTNQLSPALRDQWGGSLPGSESDQLD